MTLWGENVCGRVSGGKIYLKQIKAVDGFLSFPPCLHLPELLQYIAHAYWSGWGNLGSKSALHADVYGAKVYDEVAGKWLSDPRDDHNSLVTTQVRMRGLESEWCIFHKLGRMYLA